jgi:hypothetical protein
MALAVIPLMFWVRESTLLLCLLAFAAMWWDGKRRCAVAIALTTLASMIVSMSVNRHGQPNVHHLPTVVYMALKVPFNFVSNILGIHLWTNNFITPHVWAMDLPRVLQIGTIRKVGISKFVWMPLFTPLMWLSTFGILPTVLLHERRRGRLRALEPWMRLALIYGVISYVLGPTLGASVPRLVAYAWPAFWIATVVLLWRNDFLPRRSAVTLFACHMIASWLPWAWQSPVPLAWAVDLVVVIAMHVVAWRTLRATTPAPSDSAASA